MSGKNIVESILFAIIYPTKQKKKKPKNNVTRISFFSPAAEQREIFDGFCAPFGRQRRCSRTESVPLEGCAVVAEGRSRGGTRVGYTGCSTKPETVDIAPSSKGGTRFCNINWSQVIWSSVNNILRYTGYIFMYYISIIFSIIDYSFFVTVKLS